MGITVLLTCSSTTSEPLGYNPNMSRVVQTGVFDPREYKKTDVNWARKRKSEYLGPGKIYFTREFTRNPRYEKDPADKDRKDDDEEADDVHRVKIEVAPKKSKDIWPRKVKTDITKLY